MDFIKNIVPLKKSILLLFLSFLSSLALAQLNAFKVEYNCFYKYQQKIPDSITIVRNNETVKAPMKLPHFVDMDIVLMSVTTIGNSNGSTIITTNSNSGWKNKEQINQTDSIVYKNHKWIQYKNNEVSDMNILDIEYTYSKQEKEILGYKCERVDFYSNVDSVKGIMWVAQNLPSSIMPFGGYKPLNGAVLECTYINSGISYRAKSIKNMYSY